MTDIVQLFSGIGVVIDEAIHDDNQTPNGIQRIVQSIESKHIPLLQFEDLPDDEVISKLYSISFLILDWNLSGVQPIPKATIDDNIVFLKKLKEICFIPLFIFSDEDPHTIEVTLSENGITAENSPIFIKKKDELDTIEKLFGEIESWLKTTPSIYVLKEWEKATVEAKTKMLWALSATHPAWPKILMTSIKKDGGNQEMELIDMLQSNLKYRLSYPSLDINLIKQQKTDGITRKELRQILECERFIPSSSLPNHPFAGDVFIIGDVYYVNIRPDCDIIRDAEKDNKNMYLLSCKIVDETKINADVEDRIVFDSGEFIDKNNCCFIAFVKGNILQLSLKELTTLPWNDIKDKRIGRILPPYITKIQQKYSAYLQRQGLPRIPKEAIC
jgi:hypothetical protein